MRELLEFAVNVCQKVLSAFWQGENCLKIDDFGNYGSFGGYCRERTRRNFSLYIKNSEYHTEKVSMTSIVKIQLKHFFSAKEGRMHFSCKLLSFEGSGFSLAGKILAVYNPVFIRIYKNQICIVADFETACIDS